MKKHILTENRKIKCLKYLQEFTLNKSYYCPFCNTEIYEEIRSEISTLVTERRQIFGYKKSDEFVFNQSTLIEFQKGL